MRGLHVPHVEIVVGENGATDWAHEYRSVFHTELIDGARNQLVNNAVAAPWTIMRLALEVRLALESIVECIGPLLYDLKVRHAPPPVFRRSIVPKHREPLRGLLRWLEYSRRNGR